MTLRKINDLESEIANLRMQLDAEKNNKMDYDGAEKNLNIMKSTIQSLKDSNLRLRK